MPVVILNVIRFRKRLIKEKQICQQFREVVSYPTDDIASAHWDNEVLGQNMGSLGVCDTSRTGPGL